MQKRLPALVLLGRDAQAFSIWTLIHLEASVSGEDLVTLRSRPTVGILPQTYDEEIRKTSHGDQVLQKLDALAKDVHHAGPSSVVDRAREAATAILIAYLDTPGKDLGDLCNHQILKDEKKAIVTAAASIVARLHGRDKSAEKSRRSLPDIVDQDAELAVLCVGTILRDLGWAEW